MSSNSGLLGKVSALQLKVAGAAQPWVFLALRILFGYAIFRAGWAKLTHLDQVTGFFEHLEIPAPRVNAIVVACCESAGGLLIMAGLATRIAATVLIGVMTVALLSAHRADMAQLFHDPGKVVAAPPMPFMAMFLVLAVAGAGRLSLDHLMSRK